ncbi:MAG: c-type cytochrome biogenesis protein CcsB [Tenuifilaceae bacterium]
MKKSMLFLFSSWFMGVLFVVFALSMAVATFIENDYGAVIAFKWVYGSKWFELILLLLVVNYIGQIFVNKLLKQKKLTMVLFHLSFVLIIIGAGITRYFGFEGSMHIREGESKNSCQSLNKYIQISVTDSLGNKVFNDENKVVLSTVTVNSYSNEFKIHDINYRLNLASIVPNAFESIIDTENGKPMVYLLVSKAMMGKEPLVIAEGQVKVISNTKIGFTNQDSLDVKLSFENDSFYIQSHFPVSIVNMKSERSSLVLKGEKIPIQPMVVYTINGIKIVAQKLTKSGVIKPITFEHQNMRSNRSALAFDLSDGRSTKQIYLWTSASTEESMDSIIENGNIFKIFYGPKQINLPFEIKLNKFILERYPGSNSPSSYKSEVTLIDSERSIEEPYSIYMNNILKHRGYRFYQSSYDNDEKGTILSVNHDRAGMFVTYLGYILLILFIILSIISKNSLLNTITINAWKSTAKKASLILMVILLSSTLSFGNEQKLVIDKKVAENIGKVLVQDQKGRTKPLFTLSNDIIRKVTKKNQFEEYSSMQIFMGFYADFNHWKDVPLIKVSNADLAKNIGVNGNYAAFTNIVDLTNNNYKLAKFVDDAYAKPEGSRNKFDKEVIKLDERVNVLYMIYTGEFLKIFPLKDKSTKWGSPNQAVKFADSKEDSLYLSNIMGMIIESSQIKSSKSNTLEVDQLIGSIIDYQKKFAEYSLPNDRKVNVEVFYYKAKIFERLFPFYATLGLVMILTLIFGIVSGKGTLDKIIKYLSVLLFAGFVVHTLGLAIRWYISGHAPMSNGYESMIFISWATLLAGFIFSKNSPFALSATAVLASLTLLVAHLSFMDPEITNLVPVLKSYWLTLHVSIITGSYGFLGLGAILGLLVMILYSLINGRNRDRIQKTIDDLTVINYQTLTLGLYFLTIGTFLGAIWANESWGRYWGWDPKETWSLITIIIYSFVIHSRMIKSLKSIYTFNLLSLFAFSSVLMTYFGVNYYLSGLHSYASGDPVPIPTFVYVSIILLISISVMALRKYRTLKPV